MHQFEILLKLNRVKKGMHIYMKKKCTNGVFCWTLTSLHSMQTFIHLFFLVVFSSFLFFFDNYEYLFYNFVTKNAGLCSNIPGHHACNYLQLLQTYWMISILLVCIGRNPCQIKSTKTEKIN